MVKEKKKKSIMEMTMDYCKINQVIPQIVAAVVVIVHLLVFICIHSGI